MISSDTYDDIKRKTVSIFLLGLFTLLVFKWDVSHTLEHSHFNKTIHNPLAESNACHVSLYHQNSYKACHHKNHIGQVSEQCEDCSRLIRSQIVLVDNHIEENEVYPNFSSVFESKGLIAQEVNANTSTRAPPQFV